MLNQFLTFFPPEIIRFILVIIFALLIGLEQRRHYINLEFESVFGTDRTFTLIGILGLILYVISPQGLIPFLMGGFIVAIYLGIFYFEKIRTQKRYGLTSVVIALITYCLAPLVYTQPEWMVLLVVVTVLVLTEIKETLFEFSKKFDNTEFITLAKFLVITGVILPLLPDKPISADINISPYRFWLAIVVVSGISYASYLLKKFVFPDSGIILTGILGGLYSSTATTVILAKKSAEEPNTSHIVPAIILATTMMYVRILLLAFFFNQAIAVKLLPAFGLCTLASIALALYFFRHQSQLQPATTTKEVRSGNNPLEFKTALVFAGLFIFFALATGFVIKYYGKEGINIMALLVGVTDIDPFIINLFQSQWNISDTIIAIAVLNAISSNNVLKAAYAYAWADKNLRKNIVISFSVLIGLGIVFSLGLFFF